MDGCSGGFSTAKLVSPSCPASTAATILVSVPGTCRCRSKHKENTNRQEGGSGMMMLEKYCCVFAKCERCKREQRHQMGEGVGETEERRKEARRAATSRLCPIVLAPRCRRALSKFIYQQRNSETFAAPSCLGPEHYLASESVRRQNTSLRCLLL